jgi:hypothetical protein
MATVPVDCIDLGWWDADALARTQPAASPARDVIFRPVISSERYRTVVGLPSGGDGGLRRVDPVAPFVTH